MGMGSVGDSARKADVCSARVRKRSRLSAYVLVPLLLVSVVSVRPVRADLPAISDPVMASVTEEEWRAALADRISGTLQIPFHTSLYKRSSDVLSGLLGRLPDFFPELKLSVIFRGPHITLNYLDNISLFEVVSIASFFRDLTAADLQAYDLGGTIEVFDFENPEFTVIGHTSRFIALKPSAQFISWAGRLYALFGEKLPWVIKRHLEKTRETAIDAERAHLSLLQFGAGIGTDLSSADIELAIAKLKTVIAEQVRLTKGRGGSTKLFFSLESTPVELVSAPRSRYEHPLSLAALRINADLTPVSSAVGRFVISNPEDDRFSVPVEFNTHTVKPRLRTDSAGRLQEAAQDYPAMAPGEFESHLSPSVRNVYRRAIRNLSPTKRPAEVSAGAFPTTKLFVSTLAHPRLSPEKASEPLKLLRALDFGSDGEVSSGGALYASAVRKDVQNPADYDFLVNSVVHVPSSVATLAEAQAFAFRKFSQYLQRKLRNAVAQGKIYISELRMGSPVTMGYEDEGELGAYEANPYLTQDDVLAGAFTDEHGKRWTLEELVATGGFFKGKVDLILRAGDGTVRRQELSLQFFSGFEWREELYTIQRFDLKGVPPLMRTAVFDGADSYALAAALSATADYYSVQKGTLVARAIRDLLARFRKVPGVLTAPVLSEPLWEPKTLKKVANFVQLLESSGLGLGEVFFEETKAILIAEGRWQAGYTYATLLGSIGKVINQATFGEFNRMKRVINDLREFLERRQTLSHEAWQTRYAELMRSFQVINAGILSGQILVTPKFHTALTRLERALTDTGTAALDDIFHYDLLELEREVSVVESMNVINQGLTEFDRVFMQTMLGYAPHIYYRFLLARSLNSNEFLDWEFKMIGISADPRSRTLMNDLATGMHALTRAEFAQRQWAVFDRIPTQKNVVPVVTCNDALARITPPPTGPRSVVGGS